MMTAVWQCGLWRSYSEQVSAGFPRCHMLAWLCHLVCLETSAFASLKVLFYVVLRKNAVTVEICFVGWRTLHGWLSSVQYSTRTRTCMQNKQIAKSGNGDGRERERRCTRSNDDVSKETKMNEGRRSCTIGNEAVWEKKTTMNRRRRSCTIGNEAMWEETKIAEWRCVRGNGKVRKKNEEIRVETYIHERRRRRTEMNILHNTVMHD